MRGDKERSRQHVQRPCGRRMLDPPQEWHGDQRLGQNEQGCVAGEEGGEVDGNQIPWAVGGGGVGQM